MTVRKAIDAAEARIAAAFKDRPLVEAAIRNSLGETYAFLDEPARQLRQHEIARDLRLARLGPDHVDTLASQNGLAEAYRLNGRLAEARALFEQILPVMAARLGPDDPLTFATQTNPAYLCGQLGRLPEAIAIYERILPSMIARARGRSPPDPRDPEEPRRRPRLLRGDPARAASLDEETLAASIARLGPDHPDTIVCRSNLAVHYMEDGRVGRPSRSSSRS